MITHLFQSLRSVSFCHFPETYTISNLYEPINMSITFYQLIILVIVKVAELKI